MTSPPMASPTSRLWSVRTTVRVGGTVVQELRAAAVVVDGVAYERPPPAGVAAAVRLPRVEGAVLLDGALAGAGAGRAAADSEHDEHGCETEQHAAQHMCVQSPDRKSLAVPNETSPELRPTTMAATDTWPAHACDLLVHVGSAACRALWERCGNRRVRYCAGCSSNFYTRQLQLQLQLAQLCSLRQLRSCGRLRSCSDTRSLRPACSCMRSRRPRLKITKSTKIHYTVALIN
jgi:hypothetical protein